MNICSVDEYYIILLKGESYLTFRYPIIQRCQFSDFRLKSDFFFIFTNKFPIFIFYLFKETKKNYYFFSLQKYILFFAQFSISIVSLYSGNFIKKTLFSFYLFLFISFYLFLFIFIYLYLILFIFILFLFLFIVILLFVFLM